MRHIKLILLILFDMNRFEEGLLDGQDEEEGEEGVEGENGAEEGAPKKTKNKKKDIVSIPFGSFRYKVPVSETILPRNYDNPIKKKKPFER